MNLFVCRDCITLVLWTLVLCVGSLHAQDEHARLRHVSENVSAVILLPRPSESFHRYRALVLLRQTNGNEEDVEHIESLTEQMDLLEETLKQIDYVVVYFRKPDSLDDWSGYAQISESVEDLSSFQALPDELSHWLKSIANFNSPAAAQDTGGPALSTTPPQQLFWRLRDREVFFSSTSEGLEQLLASSSSSIQDRLIDDRDFQIAIRNLSQANDYDLLLYVPLASYRELLVRDLRMTLFMIGYSEISEESFTKCIDCVRSVTTSISLSEASEREDGPILESELFVQLTEPNPPLLEGLIRGRPVTFPSLPNDVGALQVYSQVSVDGPKVIKSFRDSIAFELVENYGEIPRAEAVESWIRDHGSAYWSDEIANHWDGISASVFGDFPRINLEISHRLREPESLGPELVELLSETFNGPYLAHDFDFETHSENDVIAVVPTNESLNRFMTGIADLDFQMAEELAISSMKRWFTEQNGRDPNDDEFRVWLAQYRKQAQARRDQTQRELARGVSIHGEWLLQWEEQQSAETDGSRIREQFEQLDERLRKELKGRSEQEYPRLLASWWDSPFKLLPPSLPQQPPADSIADDDQASPTEDRSAQPIAEQPGLDLLLYGHRVERGVSLRLSAYE